MIWRSENIVTDLADLTHPLPEHPGGSAGDDQIDGWSVLYGEGAEQREAFEKASHGPGRRARTRLARRRRARSAVTVR